MLAAGQTTDGNLRCVDASTGADTRLDAAIDGCAGMPPVAHPVNNIQALTVSPNGVWLAAGSHHQPRIQIWNLNTLERHVIVPEPANPIPIYSLNFTQDSRWLVVAAAKDTTESRHIVYEVGTWQKHGFRPTAFSPGAPIMFRNQNRMVAMTGPNEVQISDIESGRVLTSIHSANSRFNLPTALLRNDTVLALISGSTTDDIVLWDLGTIDRSLHELGLTWDLNLQTNSPRRSDRKPITLKVDDGRMADRNLQRDRLKKIMMQAERLTIARKFDEAVAIICFESDLSLVTPRQLNIVAWSLVARSDCTIDQAICARRLSEQAVALEANNSALWNTMGVACYRSQAYSQAIESLEKSELLKPGTYFADNAFFLAMSHWQLCEHGSARKWLVDAIAALDKMPSPSDELRRFRKEAEELVRPE